MITWLIILMSVCFSSLILIIVLSSPEISNWLDVIPAAEVCEIPPSFFWVSL